MERRWMKSTKSGMKSTKSGDGATTDVKRAEMTDRSFSGMISTKSGDGATTGGKKATTTSRYVSWIIPTISDEGATTDDKRARARTRIIGGSEYNEKSNQLDARGNSSLTSGYSSARGPRSQGNVYSSAGRLTTRGPRSRLTTRGPRSLGNGYSSAGRLTTDLLQLTSGYSSACQLTTRGPRSQGNVYSSAGRLTTRGPRSLGNGYSSAGRLTTDLLQLTSGYSSAGRLTTDLLQLTSGYSSAGRLTTRGPRNQGNGYSSAGRLTTRGPRNQRNGYSSAGRLTTRGPRSRGNKRVSDTPTVDKWGKLLSDQYNREDFHTSYENAKFYVIKSISEDDVHKSIKYSIWSSTNHGNVKLNDAYLKTQHDTGEDDTACPIFLFFSVNMSGQFVGVAEMIGRVDFGKDLKFWQIENWNGFFPVKWHIIKDVPNRKLRHIIVESINRPVTQCRDTQKIGLRQGLEMLRIFKNYTAVTSMVDDLKFYEEREHELREKRERDESSLNREDEIAGGDGSIEAYIAKYFPFVIC